jgi:hypothetical protein
MTPVLQLHGSIFFLLRKFVENTFDNGTWLKLNEAVGISKPDYDIHEKYDLSVFNSLRNGIAEKLSLSATEVNEKFGEYLVPDLLSFFWAHVNPAWKTYQLIENAEFVMHKAVRTQENKADPPILNVSRVHDKLLIIDYYSKRRLASLAVGIIRGIAGYYKESVRIVPTTNANDERVQIRIEFE